MSRVLPWCMFAAGMTRVRCTPWMRALVKSCGILLAVARAIQVLRFPVAWCSGGRAIIPSALLPIQTPFRKQDIAICQC